MAAANHGHDWVVELLIRHGAEINQRGSNGFTALMNAAYSGCPAVVLRLLRAGADAKARSPDSRSALQIGRASCRERV